MNSSVSIVAILIVMIIYIALITFMIITMWRLFTKANKPGWASIVPIYNAWVLVEIAKKPPLYFGMLFVPLANIVFVIMIINGIAKAFGKSEGFTVGLLFLPYIFYPILAFGSAQYEGNTVQSADLLDR